MMNMPLLHRLGLALLALLVLAIIVDSPSVAAHPLGNFSVNRYSRLLVEGERLSVSYVLDMAEIPAFQEMGTLDTNRDGQVGAAEATTYAKRKAVTILAGLQLTIDGRPVALTLVDQRLSQPAGQGGLNTLRLELELSAPLPDGATINLDYRDNNEPERLGWREIVVQAGAGRAVQQATVPATDRSAALQSYPEDLLSSPLNVRTAQATLAPAAGASAAPSPARAPIERGRDELANLITAETLSLPVMLLSLLVAFGLGAVHALSPGHGKTVVAAYLVGARGTARHALALGVTVTITHTIGVFALGLVTLFLSQYILPERLYPWLGATSGLLVVAIGLGLVASRVRGLLRLRPAVRLAAPAIGPRLATVTGPAAGGLARLALAERPAPTQAPAPDHEHHVHHGQTHGHHHHHDHEHGHHHHHGDGHDHTHEHHHDHGHDHGPDGHHDHDHAHGPHHDHQHAPGSGWLGFGHHHHHGPGGHTHEMPERITWRSLLALGISGGLLPCPSALVVLLSAIALHRVGFGLLLIVAFSAGLAAVLTGIGLLLVYASGLFNRLPVESRLVRILPIGSALLVTVAGVVITLQALAEAGLLG